MIHRIAGVALTTALMAGVAATPAMAHHAPLRTTSFASTTTTRKPPSQDLTALQAAVTSAKASLDAAQASLDKAIATRDADKAALAAAESALAATQTELAAAQDAYDAAVANDETAAVQSQLDAATLRLDAARNGVESATASLTTASATVSDLQAQLDQVRVQIASYDTGAGSGVAWGSLTTREVEKIATSMLLEKINTYRVNAGLAALPGVDQFDAAAYAWSVTMDTTGQFVHDSVPAGRIGTMYAITTMENIAVRGVSLADQKAAVISLADGFFSQWKNSAGHNTNMLLSQINAFGTGIHVTDRGTAYATLRGYGLSSQYGTLPTDVYMPAPAASTFGLAWDVTQNTSYTGTPLQQVGYLPTISAGTRPAIDVSTAVAVPADLLARETQLSADLSSAVAAKSKATADLAAAKDLLSKAQAEVDALTAELAALPAPDRSEVTRLEGVVTSLTTARDEAAAALAESGAAVVAATSVRDAAKAAYDKAVANLNAAITGGTTTTKPPKRR